MVFTTSAVGMMDVDGNTLGRDEMVGLTEGCGPAIVGGVVGAGLTHLSALMPKHCSSGLEHDPEAQASAVQQLASAVW